MKAVSFELSIVLILAAALNGKPTLLVDALSASNYGRDGAAANTIVKEDKPPTIYTVYLGSEDKQINIFVPEKSSLFSNNA